MSSAKERASPGWAGEGGLYQAGWDGGGKLLMVFESKQAFGERRRTLEKKNFTSLVPVAEKTCACLKTI